MKSLSVTVFHDLYRLIEFCLLEFRKNHKDIQYHLENREKIVNEIGKNQGETLAKLTKSGIMIAIEKALL
ncbi:MAG: hypothetical protein H0T62_09700 [Parachlamydiaceae bacterium]|nr:hypothetical protein [Parachlamydiaceae bacterium]